MMKNGTIECSVCHSRLVNPSTKTISRAYDRHQNKLSKKHRALNVLLVVGDCILVGLQPILVYMCKVDGKFKFSPVSVNFLTEVAKVIFALVMLLIQARSQKVGEKPLLSVSSFVLAARNNVLLAVPALLYAINNYLKFTMQLYFNPATVKMLSNLKVLVIVVLLKMIMKRRFSVIQWEALALLLIGISINQLRSLPEGTNAMGVPVAMGAYICTFISVTVPSLASVYNEYALKSQYDTNIYLQNLFLYGYGAIFNFLGILGTVVIEGPESFNILQGHSKATMFLIINNAAQGILSSFFYKYADTILKKYSSTVATIFTGFASAALFGHSLTINFILGISIVFISMHQFFSPLSKFKEEKDGVLKLEPFKKNADTILKKYSSTVATIFTGFASAALFGHSLTINFILGISIVFISMHQFFSPLSKVKEEKDGVLKLEPFKKNERSSDSAFINIAAGANEEASHRHVSDERKPLLPT